MRLAPLALACLLVSLPPLATNARAAEPLSLAQAMADPDWIGPPVEDAWWRWDGKAAQYTLKRSGASIRDTWQVGIDGGAAARIEGAARADLDDAGSVVDAGGMRSAFVRNGDVFVRDLRSGALQQLTRGDGDASRLQWSRDGALSWRSGGDFRRLGVGAFDAAVAAGLAVGENAGGDVPMRLEIAGAAGLGGTGADPENRGQGQGDPAAH